MTVPIAVVEAALEAECAEGGEALRDADAEVELVAALRQRARSGANCACIASAMRAARAAGVRHRHRIVEEDHDAVAGEALERALVLDGSARPSSRGTRAAPPAPPRARRVSVKAVKPRRSRNT